MWQLRISILHKKPFEPDLANDFVKAEQVIYL